MGGVPVSFASRRIPQFQPGETVYCGYDKGYVRIVHENEETPDTVDIQWESGLLGNARISDVKSEDEYEKWREELG